MQHLEMTVALAMDEDEAVEMLMETHQLSDVDLFLLETFWTDGPLPPHLMAQADNAMQRLLLAQANPPTPSLH